MVKSKQAGRYRVKATISVDHCVSDGAEAAQREACKRSRKSIGIGVAGFLENPVRMLV